MLLERLSKPRAHRLWCCSAEPLYMASLNKVLQMDPEQLSTTLDHRC